MKTIAYWRDGQYIKIKKNETTNHDQKRSTK